MQYGSSTFASLTIYGYGMSAFETQSSSRFRWCMMPYEAALLIRGDFGALRKHLDSSLFLKPSADSAELAHISVAAHIQAGAELPLAPVIEELAPPVGAAATNQAHVAIANGPSRSAAAGDIGSDRTASKQRCCEVCCFCVPPGMSVTQHGGDCAAQGLSDTQASGSKSCCTADEDDLTRAHILRSLDYETNMMLNPQTVHYGHPAGPLAVAHVADVVAGRSRSSSKLASASCPCSKKACAISPPNSSM